MLAVAPFMGRDAAARAEHPAKAYSRSRATEWVERYNATHPPEVPSPEAAPPEAGPSESAPEALPAGAPGSPTGSLRPVLGPGMIGFTGTF
jgi:hypothetical protein